MKKILSLITLFCVAGSVYGANWHRHDSVYVDDDSLKKTERSIQGWILSPNFAKSKFDNRHYVYEASYIDARCSEKSMAITQTAWYNKWHRLEIKPVDEINYIEIKPKTNNEKLFKALCIQSKV